MEDTDTKQYNIYLYNVIQKRPILVYCRKIRLGLFSLSMHSILFDNAEQYIFSCGCPTDV